LRGWRARKIAKELKRCKPLLLAAIKARTLEKLDDALKKSENWYSFSLFFSLSPSLSLFLI